MKQLILFLSLLLINTSVFAVNPRNDVMFISGTVTDQQSNESLAGVKVTVKGSSIVTYTDFNGSFFLPELPVGEYELEFQYISYETSQTVTSKCTNCPEISVHLALR
jgi:CarboxypepD_reg-like domain